MNVTVEHVVIAVVALALIYTIVQHRNVNLIEPDWKDTFLHGVAYVVPGVNELNVMDVQQTMVCANKLNNIGPGTVTLRKKTDNTDNTDNTQNFLYLNNRDDIGGSSKEVHFYEDDKTCDKVYISSWYTPEQAEAACKNMCTDRHMCTLDNQNPDYYPLPGGFVSDRDDDDFRKFKKTTSKYASTIKQIMPSNAYRCNQSNIGII